MQWLHVEMWWLTGAPQCCCLCISILVERSSCVRSTMFLPLFLFRAYWIYESYVPSTFLCIFVWRGLDLIYEGPLFDQRYSVSLLGPIWSTLLLIFVGWASSLKERLCIFVGRAWDCVRPIIWRPCVRSSSTQLALHNFTSDHVGGKEAISVHSNYLNILEACLFFFDLCFTSSSIFVIFVSNIQIELFTNDINSCTKKV